MLEIQELQAAQVVADQKVGVAVDLGIPKGGTPNNTLPWGVGCCLGEKDDVSKTFGLMIFFFLIGSFSVWSQSHVVCRLNRCCMQASTVPSRDTGISISTNLEESPKHLCYALGGK